MLFGAFHQEGLDYVVIGNFAGAAGAGLLSAAPLDLAIARSIDNCAALQRVLVELDAERCLSPRDRVPIKPHASPIRWLDGQFAFDTIAGGFDLRLPGYVSSSPPYLELQANSIRCELAENLEVTIASSDYRIGIGQACGYDRAAVDREALLRSRSQGLIAA